MVLGGACNRSNVTGPIKMHASSLTRLVKAPSFGMTQ
jgi:hypothetical protein